MRLQRPHSQRPASALLAVVLACTTLIGTASTAGAAPASGSSPPDAGERALITKAESEGPQSVIVEVPSVGDQRALAGEMRARDDGIRVTTVFDLYPLVTVTADAEAIEELAQSPDVVRVHPNEFHAPTVDTSVPVINGDDLHMRGIVGTGQAVAILDTGIDAAHEFFGDRVAAEACFSGGGGGASLCGNGENSQVGPGAAQCDDELCDHGSHVAGIAAGAAAGGNAQVNGVAPAADIIAVQVFSRYDAAEDCAPSAPPCLRATSNDVIEGLEHVQGLAGDRDVAAVNLSLGSSEHSEHCQDSPYREALQGVRAAGIAPVVSAGNDNLDNAVGSPGCVEEAITVGATDDDDSVAGYTNRGPLLDVFAPGTDVWSSVPSDSDDAYGSKNGTSMAAPHVAGAFALLREELPDAGVTELEELLERTGVDIAYESAGTEVTTPRIDLAAALPRIETFLRYTGPEQVANGTSAELSGVLTAESEDGPGVPGRDVTFTLGAGENQQECTGTTDSSGAVACTIDPVDQPLTADATVPVTAEFAGDRDYEPSDASATVLLEHYTGRAFGLSGSVPLPLVGFDIEPTPDTGQVRTADASSTDTPCLTELDLVLLQANALCPDVTTSLAPGTSVATASVDEVRIGIPGLPVIEVENATAEATATCAGDGSATGSTEMTLRIGGQLVEITGEPNAVVELPGVARIVVNEQVENPDADHGLTVNALHLTALEGGVADVVVASATSGVHNCAS
ncbi:choice-of-anchor P family protein [Promicromonospora soli]